MVWTTGHVVTAGRLGIIAITAGRRGRIDVEAIAYCRRMGFLEPERNRRSYGGGGSRVHPHDGIPRFDYIYIYLCVCVYTGRHGRLVPWEEIFGIARTF